MLPPVQHLNTAIFAQFTALSRGENKTCRTLAAMTATKQKLRDTVKLVQFFHEQSEKPSGVAWGERWFALGTNALEARQPPQCTDVHTQQARCRDRARTGGERRHVSRRRPAVPRLSLIIPQIAANLDVPIVNKKRPEAANDEVTSPLLATLRSLEKQVEELKAALLKLNEETRSGQVELAKVVLQLQLSQEESIKKQVETSKLLQQLELSRGEARQQVRDDVRKLLELIQ